MNEKPYLELPQLKLSVGMASFDPAEVREMRDKYESRIRELTEWRPMSEAPKDGTRVLLMRQSGRLCVSRYDSDKQAKAPEPFWRDDGTYRTARMREDAPVCWFRPPEAPAAARLLCLTCSAPVAGEPGVLESPPHQTHEPFSWYRDGKSYSCESCGFENVANIVECDVAEFSLPEVSRG